jgi:hypothetical protein
MKKLQITFLAAFLLNLFVFITAFAQTESLTLKISRDWGYGGLNGDIQGLFSMRLTGPVDLARVEYFIDDTKIGEVTQPPFTLQFNTDNYALGDHQLHVIGYSNTGQIYHSNIITANFVPKQSSAKVLLPVMGLILVAILLSALVPFFSGRAKHASIPMGAERHYGVGGGGICPNCHRPFALPMFSVHLGFSKLAICPFCRKLSLVRVESINKLREAEKAELESAKTEEPSKRHEEEVRKDLDDSRYQDL